MIDLHLHTNKSDGQYSPLETVDMAAKRGITLLAIADHDVLTGLEEGERRAAEAGIEFVPCIEISVEGNKELHILGYYVDYTNAGLLELCDNFIRLRVLREKRIFEYLRERGAELSEEQVMRLTPNGVAGRPHFARALVEAGHTATVQEAFDRYLATSEFSAIERTKPPAKDGIEAIINAGGVPVLAHPALLNLDNEALEKLVLELMGYGLRGIECYYSAHTEEQTAHYLTLAEKYGLLITCGSDFHGEQAKPGVEIGSGTRYLRQRDAEEMLSRLQKARAEL